MKYCEEFAALLDPYVDGELSGEEAARVRSHLERCAVCRDYVDGVLAIRAAFPEIGETAVPEGFAGGVMAAVRELEAAKEEQALPAARRNRYWKKILLPLAACFAVVLAVRTVPGSGSDIPANNAAPTAMDTAAPAGDSGGQYGPAARQVEADDEGLPAEADAGSALPPRMAAEDPAAQDGVSAVLSSSPPESITPQTEEGAAVRSTSGPGGELYAWRCRTIRLTAAQAGELLADLPYTAGEDGVRCYQLPGGDFDALLEALAERGIVPSEEETEAEYLPEGYDLVYVTEE